LLPHTGIKKNRRRTELTRTFMLSSSCRPCPSSAPFPFLSSWLHDSFIWSWSCLFGVSLHRLKHTSFILLPQLPPSLPPSLPHPLPLLLTHTMNHAHLLPSLPPSLPSLPPQDSGRAPQKSREAGREGGREGRKEGTPRKLALQLSHDDLLDERLLPTHVPPQLFL